MTELVVDASAVISALVDAGPAGTWSRQLLAGGALAAPELLPFEAANVLRRLSSTRALTPDAAALAHEDLLDLVVELWPYAALATDVWALRGSLTCYDASYVALAGRLGCPLVTLDARLARSARTRCDVRLPPRGTR